MKFSAKKNSLDSSKEEREVHSLSKAHFNDTKSVNWYKMTQLLLFFCSVGNTYELDDKRSAKKKLEVLLVELCV